MVGVHVNFVSKCILTVNYCVDLCNQVTNSRVTKRQTAHSTVNDLSNFLALEP